MRTTVTLDDDLGGYVDDQDASSDAEAVRQCIRRCRELEERVGELETEIEELRREKETLMKRREQLERIEQRMATSDEIETYQRSTILSWIKNRLP